MLESVINSQTIENTPDAIHPTTGCLIEKLQGDSGLVLTPVALSAQCEADAVVRKSTNG